MAPLILNLYPSWPLNLRGEMKGVTVGDMCLVITELLGTNSCLLACAAVLISLKLGAFRRPTVASFRRAVFHLRACSVCG